VLESAGLARTQKIGRVRTAHLERAGLEALQAWLDQRRSLWERRLDALGELLEDPPPEA
jgi:hypothetical protein